MSEVIRRAEQGVDVALLLEGTFPYVSGGVSSWVNQIIRAHPDLRFAVVFIGSRRSDYGDMRYALPDNVVHLEAHYLHDDLGGGASVGEGRSLKVTADLADALFDAGYKLNIDAAAEDMRDSPRDISVPLTKAGAGKPVSGRSYVAGFTYGL